MILWYHVCGMVNPRGVNMYMVHSYIFLWKTVGLYHVCILHHHPYLILMIFILVILQGGGLASLAPCLYLCLSACSTWYGMVWNSLCIPCMDSSLTMSRWSTVHICWLFNYNFKGYRSAWQMRPPFTHYLGSRTFHCACAFMTSCLSTLLNQSTNSLSRSSPLS